MFNLDEFEIELGHSVCRGRCPVYAVKILGSGEVVFQGHSFTSTIGRVEEELQEQQIKAIASEIYKFGYFDIKKDEFCTELVMDASVTYLRIKLENIEHETEFCSGHPPEPVMELVRKIETIVDTARWVYSDDA